MAESVEERHEYDEADRMYREVEGSYPRSGIAMILHARMLERAERPQEAANLYRRLFARLRAERNEIGLSFQCRYAYLLDKLGEQAESDRELKDAMLRLMLVQQFTAPQYRLDKDTFDERMAIALLHWSGMEPGDKSPREMDWAVYEAARRAPTSPVVLIHCALRMDSFDEPGEREMFVRAHECATEADRLWLRENIYNHTGYTYDQFFSER